jgi:hypothetical protein
MTAAFVETHAIAAVLGLRFLDHTTGLPVLAGIRATAVPVDQSGVAVPGLAGPSGVVSFHQLPGLRDVEFPSAELAGGPASFPSGVEYFVMIEDGAERFLPAIFTVQLPLDPTGATLPLLDVPVFAAPARPVTPGFAAIRADLRDVDTDEPIAHAVVRVDVGGVAGIGIADGRGRVLVLVQTPVVDRLRLGSPPGTGQAALGHQTWPVTVRVFALSASAPAADRPGLRPPWGTLPSLKTILTEQPQVSVYPVPGTSAPEWSGMLTAGTELILRTGSFSHLSISRGASPP